METLLERGTEGDLAEAQEAIDRLANLPADEGSAMREIRLLRLRALLARARGDDVAYRDLVSRYRAMAESLGFEGHIAWAEAMIDGECSLNQSWFAVPRPFPTVANGSLDTPPRPRRARSRLPLRFAVAAPAPPSRS